MNQNMGLHSIWVYITLVPVVFLNFMLGILGLRNGILLDEKDPVLDCDKQGK